MKRFLFGAFAVLLATAASAQQVVSTLPSSRATGNASGTIAVTDTFQSLWAKNVARVGCAIQNKGAATQWVFFGPIASATKALSVSLAPGQAVGCAAGGVVATDQVSITGTATQQFFATQDGSPQIGPSGTTSFATGSAVGIDQTTPGTSNGVALPGAVSTGNSSVALLGNAGVFTGAWVDNIAYGSINVSSFSNVASGTNGLSIQQSSDGVNADITDVYTVAAGVSTKINVPRQARYFRVVYTNAAGAQASFRLQTIQSAQMPSASSVKPADALTIENDYSQVLAAQQLFDGTASFNLARGLADNADGVAVSATINKLASLDRNTLFNGTTWDRQFTCANSAAISVTAGTTLQLVALAASQQIRVCSFAISTNLAGTATFVYGTGANCVTSPTNLTGAFNIATGTGFAASSGTGSLFRTAASNALCLTAVTGNVTGFVTYAQF